MKLSRSQIKKIIIEEYLKDRFITEAMSREKADEVLAWIRGESPRPKWLTDDYGKSGKPKSGQAPMSTGADRVADTMPFPAGDDVPADDAPERDLSGFQDRSGPPLEDQVTALVQDLQPEEMLDLFTSVIEKLAPEYIEPQRREIGFREVKYIIQEVMKEVGDYHFGFDDEEKYDALDPHGFEKMSDYELIDAMETDGMEDMIVRDGEGGLVNREEVIAALKDV